jgi:hypothetical protein
MKSFVITTVLASLCTAFAHEEAAAQPMRKRHQMQHKSSSANARVLATEEYDPYLGIRQLQGPGEEEAAAVALAGSLSLSAPAVQAGGAPEAGGPEAGGPEAGGPEAGGPEAAAAPMSMQMSMATEGETEDKGILETVGDKIADLTGQSR